MHTNLRFCVTRGKVHAICSELLFSTDCCVTEIFNADATFQHFTLFLAIERSYEELNVVILLESSLHWIVSLVREAEHVVEDVIFKTEDLALL